VIREVKEPMATHVGQPQREDDWKHQVYYTHDLDAAGTILGTIAIVFRGEQRDLWRLGDKRLEPIDFDNARRRT
jgi:hypothetical protein